MFCEECFVDFHLLKNWFNLLFLLLAKMNSETIPSKYISKKWLEFHPSILTPSYRQVCNVLPFCWEYFNQLDVQVYSFYKHPRKQCSLKEVLKDCHSRTQSLQNQTNNCKWCDSQTPLVQWRNSVTAATTFSFCLLKLKFNWKGITSERCYLFEAGFSKFCTYHMIRSGSKQVLVQDIQKISKTQGQQEILVYK